MNIALHHLYNRASTAAYQLPGLRSLFYIIDLCVSTDKLRIFLNVPKRSTINTFSLFTAFKGNLVLFSFIRKKKKEKKNELHTPRIHQSVVITVLSPEAREIKTIPSSSNVASPQPPCLPWRLLQTPCKQHPVCSNLVWLAASLQICNYQLGVINEAFPKNRKMDRYERLFQFTPVCVSLGRTTTVPSGQLEAWARETKAEDGLTATAWWE